ncbi:MAG: zinc metalloprotease HtpX [Deltaproteobacteria bacterium]|nr:zinc metalloprotease HtpX [Deltaproteobacteria bacterium]
MKNQLKTVLLLGILSALLIWIGGAIAPGQLWVFVAIAGAMNLFAYFYSDKLVLKMYRAQEVSAQEAPDLHAIVRELANTAKIPMPRVFLIPDRQPNAFATGRNPQHAAVAVTAGILQILDRRELRGVLAHELAHVGNRDILISTIAAVIASAITTIAQVLSFGAMFGGRGGGDGDRSPLGGLALLIMAPIAATLIQLAISRSRELHADATGAKLSGDPEALASALMKLERGAQAIPAQHVAPATASLFIVNPFGALDRLSRLFSTHPPTAERVRALREMEHSDRYAHAY